MTEEKCKELCRELKSWISATEHGIKQLRALTYELEDFSGDPKTGNRFQTGAAVAGGITSETGFGLAFYTFALSLVINVIGDDTNVSSERSNERETVPTFLKLKETKEKAADAYTEYNQSQRRLTEVCIELAEQLKHLADIDTVFTEFVDFWRWLLYRHEGGEPAAELGWSSIEQRLRNTLIFEIRNGANETEVTSTLHEFARGIERRLPAERAVETMISKTLDKINKCYFQKHFC